MHISLIILSKLVYILYSEAGDSWVYYIAAHYIFVSKVKCHYDICAFQNYFFIMSSTGTEFCATSLLNG